MQVGGRRVPTPQKGGQILRSFSPPTFTHLLLPLLHNTDNPPTRSHSPAMSETIKSTSIFSPVPSVTRRTNPLRSISAISATPIAPPPDAANYVARLPFLSLSARTTL